MMWIAYGGRSKNYKAPAWYHVKKASEILGVSFLELLNHPEKHELMDIAATFADGESRGNKALADRRK